MRYKLLADDVLVWSGDVPPTKDQIDRVASDATASGWNGTVLDLCCDDRFVDYVYPSEEALS